MTFIGLKCFRTQLFCVCKCNVVVELLDYTCHVLTVYFICLQPIDRLACRSIGCRVVMQQMASFCTYSFIRPLYPKLYQAKDNTVLCLSVGIWGRVHLIWEGLGLFFNVRDCARKPRIYS